MWKSVMTAEKMSQMRRVFTEFEKTGVTWTKKAATASQGTGLGMDRETRKGMTYMGATGKVGSWKIRILTKDFEPYLDRSGEPLNNGEICTLEKSLCPQEDRWGMYQTRRLLKSSREDAMRGWTRAEDVELQRRGTSLGVQRFRFCLPAQGVWVWYLARDLRSHMPCGKNTEI